jgi:hypothetical protein
MEENQVIVQKSETKENQVDKKIEVEENQVDKKIEVEVNQVYKENKSKEKHSVTIKLSTLIKDYKLLSETQQKQVNEKLTDLAKVHKNLKMDNLYLPNFIATHEPSSYEFLKLFKLLMELGFSYETNHDFIYYLFNNIELNQELASTYSIRATTNYNKWVQPIIDKDSGLQVKLAAAIVNSTCLRFNNFGLDAFIPKESGEKEEEEEEEEKDEEEDEDEDEEDNTNTKKQKLEEN